MCQSVTNRIDATIEIAFTMTLAVFSMAKFLRFEWRLIMKNKRNGFKNRSYRRFFQEKKITTDQLKGLIEVARLTPSAANRQPYKFKLISDETMNKKIFSFV